MYYELNSLDQVFLSRSTPIIETDLPVATYSVSFDPDQGMYYLQKIDNMQTPERVYGTVQADATRIINTYESKKSMGVILNGSKGTGKTLTTKLISEHLRTRSQAPMSTIIVNSPFYGESFNQFIGNLPKSLIIFDEFEKVYHDGHNQARMLTILDGTIENSHLFLISSNSKHGLNSNLLNRPGRAFYYLKYESLEISAIEEYCIEKLKNMDYLKDIINLAKTSSIFTFDMLSALVTEMNMYNESVNDSMRFLNISLELSDFIDGKISKLLLWNKETQKFDIEAKTSSQSFRFDIWSRTSIPFSVGGKVINNVVKNTSSIDFGSKPTPVPTLTDEENFQTEGCFEVEMSDLSIIKNGEYHFERPEKFFIIVKEESQITNFEKYFAF